MAYSKGGSTTTLITGYSEGEDANIDYGRNTYLAQTFTLDVETALWRCRFKSWTICGDKVYHYDLHHTDAMGKPIGAPIASTTLSPTGEYWFSPGRWRRFDFDEFPKLAPGVYALVASVPTSPSPLCYSLRADSTASAFTQGKAWRSTDGGSTWTELANQDFYFEVWGYIPPPEPPPPPSLSNFSTRDIAYTHLCDGFKITVTTDILCHLYMRWTTVEPQYQTVPLLRRGISMHGDRTFCFVAYQDNEQEEAGDTLVHTFIKRNWPICETRYFYFWATVATQEQPSTSPIFHLHFDIIFQEFIGTLSNRTVYKTHGTWNVAHDAPVGAILPNYDAPNYFIFAGDELTVSFWIYRGLLFFDTSALPADIKIAGAFLDLFVEWHKPTAPGATPWLGITEGVQADPVVPANYGAQLPYTAVGGSRIISTMIDGQYNRIHFDEAGLAFIKPGGITKLCLRADSNINDSPPGLGAYYVRLYSAQKGTPYQPKLTLCLPP
ncbi:hypothetical protein ES708_10255 [subsurface metagenome]